MLVLEHIETPNPFTPGGVKGAGETATVGPPAMLAKGQRSRFPSGMRV